MPIDGCTLTYFPVPGRGEAARLALTISKVKFTDKRTPFTEWGKLKPRTPWGSLPMLTLSDGSQLGQQRAILRLVGRSTGLYPSDPLLGSRCDEIMDVMEDLLHVVNSAGHNKASDVKAEARRETLEEGEAFALLCRIDAFIGSQGFFGHVVGETLTVADLMVFTTLNNLVSGAFDGVPADALKRFGHLQEARKTVANHPAVVAYYDAMVEPHAYYSVYVKARNIEEADRPTQW